MDFGPRDSGCFGVVGSGCKRAGEAICLRVKRSDEEMTRDLKSNSSDSLGPQPAGFR